MSNNILRDDSHFPHVRWMNKTKKPRSKSREDHGNGENSASVIPSERWGHQTVVLNDSMYLIGGYNEHSPTQTVYKLDCTTYEWEEVSIKSAEKPPHRDSHSVCLLRGELYLFGGKQVTPIETVYNDQWALDPVSGKWREIDHQGEIPPARESHQACVLQNRYIVVFGGTNGADEEDTPEIFGDFYIFDVETNIWKEIKQKSGDVIEGRESFSMVSLNGYIFVFGGQSLREGTFEDLTFNDFYQIQLQIDESGEASMVTKEIKRGKDPKWPCERAMHSSCVYKDRFIFVIGGERNDKTKLDDVLAFDVEGQQWEEIKESVRQNQVHLLPIISHSSTTYKDNIIIFGGMVRNQNRHSNETRVLSLTGQEPEILNKSSTSLSIIQPSVGQRQGGLQIEVQKEQAESKMAEEDEEGVLCLEDVIRSEEGEIDSHLRQANEGLEESQSKEIQIRKKKESISQGLQERKLSKKDIQEVEIQDDAIEEGEIEVGVMEDSANKISYEMVLEEGVNENSNNEVTVQSNQESRQKEQQQDSVSQQDEEESQEDNKASPSAQNMDSKDDQVRESELQLRNQEREAQINKAKKELAHANLHQQLNEDQILHIRQPCFSMSFLTSISNLIDWPFAAIGLLVHNAKSQQGIQNLFNILTSEPPAF